MADQHFSAAAAARPAVAAVALALMLAGCGPSGSGPTGPGGPGGGMPPPSVGVLTVQPQSLNLSTELPGRLEPVRTAQVRARVTGW
ncbi:hypothetical protein VITFI_CDS0501 [Vitreoscilla filiformis]|uniref:Efflux transporter periplasmic adaptor subunit n=1 Tax=Vitreoscilla filiformis TaxID=63 RepID=A0A221KBR1_VITFI|nr:hypothetical protein [Vitreoscilla filiformis]ASM76280.1 hypothetical protein VITFI_CDS0501 [Vitreoscilla filiformis]